MKSSQIFVAGLMGLSLIFPAIASAEEGTTGDTGSVTPPAGTAPAEGWSFGESRPPMPPGGAGAGREAPSKPKLMREEGSGKATPKLMEKVSPRDPASGQATGKRMMASGTKPLPPEMEKRMENRDKMMASGTPKNGEKREEMEQRQKERREEVVKRIAGEMIKRLEAAIARYEKLADRIDTRIAKLKEKGNDTSLAEKDIALARTKIQEAKDAVALAKNNTSNGAEGTPSNKESLAKAREAVLSAHKALVEATKKLKSKDDATRNTQPIDAGVTP